MDEVFAFVEDARNRPRRPGALLRLFQPLIARTTQANLDRGFPRLKQVLENAA